MTSWIATRTSLVPVLAFILTFTLFVGPALADFSAVVEPQQAVSVKAGKGRYTKLEFTNSSTAEACLDIESRGFSGEVCVPANETISITKIFDGEVSITNKSLVATITIHGKWL